MSKPEVIYLIISGAGSVRMLPKLIAALTQFDLPLFTLLTDNARYVISPLQLVAQPGHTLIDSYFDPALSSGRRPGLVLVAPATFNTVNKIRQGIADTLAHSLIAEAIGDGWPVIVTPAMNRALANHPQFTRSVDTLREWKVTVIPPEADSLKMASLEQIIAAVKQKL